MHYSYKSLIDDLVQDCSSSIANALELLQSCTKPWKYSHKHIDDMCLQGNLSAFRILDFVSNLLWEP